MEQIEHYKQLHDLIADETNVKSISTVVGVTDKGNLELVYDVGKRSYTFVLPGKEQPASDALVVKILQEFFSQKNC